MRRGWVGSQLFGMFVFAAATTSAVAQCTYDPSGFRVHLDCWRDAPCTAGNQWILNDFSCFPWTSTGRG